MQNSATSVAAEKIIADLKTLVRDGEDLLKASAGDLSEKGREAREKLAEALEAAKDCCGKLEERASAGAKVADRAIREHPYESVGVAFGLGLIIGVLITRR
jgi:ElaB/YqjD/DUF883 family membrane-anchored ribosome-binding protein